MSARVIAISEFTQLQQRLIMELCHPQWVRRSHRAIVEALNDERRKMKESIETRSTQAGLWDMEQTNMEAFTQLKDLGVVEEVVYHMPNHQTLIFYKLQGREQ